MSMESTSLVLIALATFVVGLNATTILHDSENLFRYRVQRQSSVNIDDVSCDSQLSLFSEALLAQDLWALKLFDTWGKIQSGYLEGNRYNLGHFTQCRNFNYEALRIDNQSRTIERIEGQYCLIGVIAANSTMANRTVGNFFDWRQLGAFVRNFDLLLINGICLPMKCSSEKVVQFANIFLSPSDLVAIGAQCQPTNTEAFTVLDAVAVGTFSLFSLLLLFSTLYDVIKRRQSMDPNQFLISFSAYTNGKKLFDISESKSPNSIRCLNGLRGISVLWIIFGHRFVNQQRFPLTNHATVHELYNNIYSVILTSYDSAVDTFFVMGAVLLTMSVLKALDKRALNIPRLILHRYIRYTPVLAALILYLVSIDKFTADGPIQVTEFRNQCLDGWWQALLHIQNYANPSMQCASHAWYLSADFQLFIISPFLIYPAWRWGWKYLWTLPIMAVSSSVYALIIALLNHYRVLTRSTSDAGEFARQIYFATHARMGPWLLGIVLGYMLYMSRNRKSIISKNLNAIMWIMSISVLAAVVLLAQPLNQPIDNQTSLQFNAFYIAYHRLAWAIAICWIIYACHKLKTGGVIRWILSLPEWQPIAKMSLSMYLVHLPYQVMTMANQKNAVTFEIGSMLHIYCGDVMVTLMLGAVLYLAFEAPCLMMEKYFYEKRNRKQFQVSK